MNKSSGKVLMVFGIFWTTLVLAFDVIIVSAAIHQQLATSYPTVIGQITKSEVTQERGTEGGTQYGVDIQYDYDVDGKRYHGSRFRYMAGSSSDGGWAYAAVQAYPAGAQTTVYYRPGRPEESLLSPGIGGGELFMLLFLTPFNMVMLGIWAGICGALRGRGGTPVAGGVKIATEGTRVRIRLPRYSPWLVGLASLGVSAFMAMFIVAFFFGGFHPSLKVIVPAWAVVLAISVPAFLWRWMRGGSGAEDMVIDEAAGTMRLPQTFGRKGQISVAIPNIVSMRVQRITHQTKNGRNFSYAPVINLRNESITDGKLAEFYDEKKANAFADWLRARLRLPPASHRVEDSIDAREG